MKKRAALGQDAPVTVSQKSEKSRSVDPAAATDDMGAIDVLLATGACAASWEPSARILGNVRAGDIVRAVDRVERYEKELRADLHLLRKLRGVCRLSYLEAINHRIKSLEMAIKP